MASFSAPSQICLVIKLGVYRCLPLDYLSFKLNLPSLMPSGKESPSKKTKIGDFKFKIAIHQLIKPFIFKFLAFLREVKSFDSLPCNNKMINLRFSLLMNKFLI